MEARAKTGFSAGFTLIELMIGIAVTVLVMAALIEVFSSQQRVYYQQSQLAKSQAAARTALSQLSRDARMAGYTGVPLGTDMLAMNRAATNFVPLMSLKDGNTLLTGVAGTTGPMAYAEDILADLGPFDINGDILEIRGNFGRRTTTVTQSITTVSNSIRVANPEIFLPADGFNSPGWIVAGRVRQAAVVQILPITDVTGDEIEIGINPPFDIMLLAGSTAAGEIIWAAPVWSRAYFATGNATSIPANQRNRLMIANYKPTADNQGLVRAGGPVEFAVDIADFRVRYNTVTAAADRIATGLGLVTDPCAVRGITMQIQTFSDQYREDRPLLRDFSTTVKVRNIGFTTASCPL